MGKKIRKDILASLLLGVIFISFVLVLFIIQINNLYKDYTNLPVSVILSLTDMDEGIVRKLPPIHEDNTDLTLSKRNILDVKIDSKDQIYVRGKKVELNEVRIVAKRFIKNEFNDNNLPELREVNLKYFGKVKLTATHLIILMNDRGVSYNTYIQVQNELSGAYIDLRNELATKKWRVPFDDLDDDKKSVIENYYPMKISESEPKKC